VAETAATDFKQNQKPTFESAMLSEATTVWDRLSFLSPRLLPRAIAFVARHKNEKAILEAIRQIPAGSDSALQAQCWLAALENTHQKQELHDSVERSLRHLVAAQPNNMQLRQAYVGYLVQFAGYDSAVTIERQILQREPQNIEALSRCAWILTMADGDQSEAMTLSESESRHAPSNASVRTTRALVLAKSNNPNQALPVFDSIPAESRTAESFAYEALALLRSGKHREALQMADTLQRQHTLERWRLADRALLEDVLQQAAAAEVASK
jgi:tetratricopeptide (TPR) repeat protein